ncbi:hypothetical protein SUDANB176_04417 [Streptomyces sp. enrichment culture]
MTRQLPGARASLRRSTSSWAPSASPMKRSSATGESATGRSESGVLRACPATAAIPWATWRRSGSVGIPVPMSRNWRTPWPVTQGTARCMKARFTRAMTGTTGAKATSRLPGSSSTGWSSLPPRNRSYIREGCGSPVPVGGGVPVPASCCPP